MAEEMPRFTIRCTFCKQGRLAMLSHLEVACALERAVRRANLPFGISQGFSPHMLLHFGAALPVGVGGTCEIFDLTLREYVAPDKVLGALQKASVPDLMVLECAYIDKKAKAASIAYPISTYLVRFSGSAEGLAFPETVTVVRKKKEKTLVVSEFLVGELQIQDNAALFSLEAKQTGSLRPDRLLEAALADYNETREGDPLVIVSFTRIAQQ